MILFIATQILQNSLEESMSNQCQILRILLMNWVEILEIK